MRVLEMSLIMEIYLKAGALALAIMEERKSVVRWLDLPSPGRL